MSHLDNPYRKVALQFPDELLQYSVPLYHSLRGKAPGKEFFVMADTTFGRYVSGTRPSFDLSFLIISFIQLLRG